ncbi:uncharacterized protein LOC128244009, partial [Mya arenaria]
FEGEGCEQRCTSNLHWINDFIAKSPFGNRLRSLLTEHHSRPRCRRVTWQKNKPKSQSQKSKKQKAFVVNSVKKAKTKPIATNLKKMNLQSKAKTEKADESFRSIRKELTEAAKTSSQKPKQSPKAQKLPKKDVEAVDMDIAAESFSKL